MNYKETFNDSMIVTASNYQMNIICIKLNEIAKDPEIGTPLYDPTTMMMHVIVKTIVNDI